MNSTAAVVMLWFLILQCALISCVVRDMRADLAAIRTVLAPVQDHERVHP